MSDNAHSLARLDAVVILDAINSLKKQLTKMNKRMVNTIQSVDKKIATISADVDSLRADVAKLQTFATDTAAPAFADQVKAFADAHNDASKFANSHIDNRNTQLYSLRTQENKEIEGFPQDISDLDNFLLMEITHILTEFGCDLDDLDQYCRSMNDAYKERELRKTLHFYLGIDDNFPVEV